VEVLADGGGNRGQELAGLENRSMSVAFVLNSTEELKGLVLPR
jgi:hypothetical protein